MSVSIHGPEASSCGSEVPKTFRLGLERQPVDCRFDQFTSITGCRFCQLYEYYCLGALLETHMWLLAKQGNNNYIVHDSSSSRCCRLVARQLQSGVPIGDEQVDAGYYIF